jgi:murein DD-endopeptidase MepM/ murein hydrolase activator NlpD
MLRSIFISILIIYNTSICNSQQISIDTVQALVQYGNERILDESFYSVKDKKKYLDSLQLIIPDKKRDLDFLASVLYEPAHVKMILVDSLMNTGNIRYDLINELENMIYYIRDETMPNKYNFIEFTANSDFPSDLIYKTWDTKNFRNKINIDLDSSYLIQLTSEKYGDYFHPVCKSSLKKYEGMVTSKQGWRDAKRHNGVDINMDQWDSVQCAFSGRVRFVKEFEGYGKVVVVRHYNGLETIYAHLAKFKVKPGQMINAGDLIGLAGNTGNSEGSHLHFEIRFKDQVLNPENLIDFSGYTLRSQKILVKKTGNSFVAVPKDNLFHVIERGDYPFRIASRYGMSVDYFCEINKISTKTKLKVGESVIIE